MINLWAQFPQRGTHRVAISVDGYDGFQVAFIPLDAGVTGSFAPKVADAKRLITLIDEYLAERQPAECRAGRDPSWESFISLEFNGFLTRVQLKRGYDQFNAQLVDDELRNLREALRFYFRLPSPTGVLRRGRDW